MYAPAIGVQGIPRSPWRRRLLRLHPLHRAVEVVQDALHISLAEDLKLQVDPVVQLDLGMPDPLMHLPERVRQVQPPLGHAAEVDGEVRTAGHSLVQCQHQVVAVLALVLQQLQLRHHDFLAPDAVVVGKGELQGAGVLQQVHLELVVDVREVDEEDGVGLHRVERPLAHALQHELHVIMADHALQLPVLGPDFVRGGA